MVIIAVNVILFKFCQLTNMTNSFHDALLERAYKLTLQVSIWNSPAILFLILANFVALSCSVAYWDGTESEFTNEL